MDEEDYSGLLIPSFHTRYVYPPPHFVPEQPAFTPPPVPQSHPTPNPNVIIPTTGAAKYWYVDPNATPQQFRGADLARPNPIPSQTENDTALRKMASDLVTRTPIKGGTDYTKEGPTVKAPQVPADIYDKMRYQGMTQPANVDHEIAQGTGIYEMDGTHYLLPTKIEGQNLSRDEVLNRFRTTGEHLGGFGNLKDARNYERNYFAF